MLPSLNAKILADPNYRTLLRKRRHHALRHGALMFCVYAGFILLSAFEPHFMARPMTGGITAGLAAGAGVVVFSLWIARRHAARAQDFDELINQILQELKQCPR